MAPIHTVAQKGFGTGTNQLYDRSLSAYTTFCYWCNSTYPQCSALLPTICIGFYPQRYQIKFTAQHCRVSTLSISLYLLMLCRIGSGTGIFTRALLAHKKWNAAIKQIKAIEPSEGMRSVFSQQVKDDRVTVAEGTFIATGIADGWADLVVIAQVCSFSLSLCTGSQFYHRPIIGVLTMMQLLQNSLVSSSPTGLLLLFGI